MTYDVGEGSPIVKEVTSRGETINKTAFTRGDRVVAVRWLHRFAGDMSRLTFVKDAYSSERDYDVINSTELRAVGFSMKKVRLPATPHICAVTTRSSTRGGGPAAVQQEPDIHYVLDHEIEEGIHKQNW